LAKGVANGLANGVAIYARVSTDDKGQTPDNQLLPLRAWCERMGYPVVREYVEHEKGGKGTEYRKQLAAMFTGAGRREFDLLLVWSLDRFSREGMAATVAHLQRLASHGVAFRSFTVAAAPLDAGDACPLRGPWAGLVLWVGPRWRPVLMVRPAILANQRTRHRSASQPDSVDGPWARQQQEPAWLRQDTTDGSHPKKTGFGGGLNRPRGFLNCWDNEDSRGACVRYPQPGPQLCRSRSSVDPQIGDGAMRGGEPWRS
jgi:Resolvase, N terminal domain